VSFMTSASKFPSPQKHSKCSKQGILEQPGTWKLYKGERLFLGDGVKIIPTKTQIQKARYANTDLPKM
jgi:hypothetical protein